MLRLFDTARAAVVPVEFREPGQVSMYVCGPTVYGAVHIGHGRFSLVFDVLRRYLEWSGYEVRYVSNITDIDDKIIERAEKESRDWREITAESEALWYRAMDAIGVKRPTADPHATAYVDQMLDLIGRLADAGLAYETSDGVYLDTSQVDGYGLLAGQSLESLRIGARVETHEQKRSPIDFVLWKKSKPGEPSWPSPWGDGRPGWHTECVVMSLDLLGEGFDIHGGGQDLKFPHHENERAQAVALGHAFARHWVHNGFVEMSGEKMSRSVGNVTDLLSLAESGDSRAYRLLVLQAHYRAPIEVSPETIAAAGRALERLDSFARRFAASATGVTPAADALAAFGERMDDDLDTPGATALVFEWVRRANADGDLAIAAAALEACRAVGLELRSDIGAVDDEAAEIARRRDEARTGRDWATADQLRDQLTAMGYEVTDTPEGTLLRRL